MGLWYFGTNKKMNSTFLLTGGKLKHLTNHWNRVLRRVVGTSASYSIKALCLKVVGWRRRRCTSKQRSSTRQRQRGDTGRREDNPSKVFQQVSPGGSSGSAVSSSPRPVVVVLVQSWPSSSSSGLVRRASSVIKLKPPRPIHTVQSQTKQPNKRKIHPSLPQTV